MVQLLEGVDKQMQLLTSLPDKIVQDWGVYQNLRRTVETVRISLPMVEGLKRYTCPWQSTLVSSKLFCLVKFPHKSCLSTWTPIRSLCSFNFSLPSVYLYGCGPCITDRQFFSGVWLAKLTAVKFSLMMSSFSCLVTVWLAALPCAHDTGSRFFDMPLLLPTSWGGVAPLTPTFWRNWPLGNSWRWTCTVNWWTLSLSFFSVSYFLQLATLLVLSF